MFLIKENFWQEIFVIYSAFILLSNINKNLTLILLLINVNKYSFLNTYKTFVCDIFYFTPIYMKLISFGFKYFKKISI